MEWFVWFVVATLGPVDPAPRITPHLQASFPDRAACERWVGEVEKQAPATVEIKSECQSAKDVQDEFFDSLNEALKKNFPAS